jgi:hypothetical protein
LNKKYVNIIFISSEWNEYHRKEFTEELYKKINSWSDVLIVQLPVSLFVHLFTNFKQKIIGLFTGNYKTVKLQDKVFLFTPVILFHYLLWLKFKPFSYIDSLLLKIQINSFIKKKFRSDFKILWLYFPQLFPCTDVLDYNYLVYDYYDNFDYDYEGKIIRRDSEYNEKLIRKSNFIICTARRLYERAKALNNNSFYIPNGNSFEKISNADIRKINFIKKRKTVGYLGTYRNWVDFELVEELIDRFKDVDFLFVGGIHPTAIESFEKLKKKDNFHYIPPQAFEIAVSYLKIFDIGIIPFKINKFTEGVFPNKFFEYLAAGIPIVTTALPDLKGFSYFIEYSETNEQFFKSVQKLLKTEFIRDTKNYTLLASNNSWKNKIEILNGLLVNLVKNI